MIIASLPSRKQQICSIKTKITLIKLIIICYSIIEIRIIS